MDPSTSPEQPAASSLTLLDLLRGTPKSDSASSSAPAYSAPPDAVMHTASLLEVLHQSTISTERLATDTATATAASVSADESTGTPTGTRVDEASTAELKSVLFRGLGLDSGIKSDGEEQTSSSHHHHHQHQQHSMVSAPLPETALPSMVLPVAMVDEAAAAPIATVVTMPTTAEQLERSLSGGRTSAQPSTAQATSGTTETAANDEATTTPEPDKAPAPLFTYVNPFDLLSKSKRAASGTSTATPSTTAEPTSANSEPSVQSGYGVSSALFPPPMSAASGNGGGGGGGGGGTLNVAGQDGAGGEGSGGGGGGEGVDGGVQPIQRHHSPMMVGSLHDSPEHTARLAREQHAREFVKGVPNGVRLSGGNARINVASSNLSMMAAQDLEVTTITLMPTEAQLYTGNIIAATKTLFAYATKGGRFRVLHQLYGTRALIPGHEHCILDMAFFNALQGNYDPHRLATVGIDHRLCVWEFDEPHPTKRADEIPSRIILELDGAPANVNEPRFRRAVWHPSNPDILACTADRGHLLIFNLQVMLAGKESPHVVEGDHNVGAIQLKGHPIVDLCFSADGNEIITASEDGTVRLWHITEADGSCVGVFTPCDGQPVTAVKFVENIIDGHISDAHRCIIVASDQNRVIKLLSHDGTQCIQQLVFAHDGPGEPVDFFNVINYDTITKTLIVANSYRESLYCVHIRLDDAPQWVYLVEFPLEYPIVSLALAPDCAEEADTFALCCIQTGAVQRFHVPFRTVLPRRWERCQMADERANARRTAIEPTRSASIESHGKGKTPKTATATTSGGSARSMPSPSQLPHAALGKAAGKLMETNAMIRDHPAFRSPLLKPRTESSEADTGATVTVAQLRSLEDNVVSRMGKLLNKELLKRVGDRGDQWRGCRAGAEGDVDQHAQGADPAGDHRRLAARHGAYDAGVRARCHATGMAAIARVHTQHAAIEHGPPSTHTMTNDLKQVLMPPRPVFAGQASPSSVPSAPQSAVPVAVAATPTAPEPAAAAAAAPHNVEEALVKALGSKQPAMLELLMQQLNPTAVFPAHQPTTLSQPIVLALLHQLGLDMQQCALPQQQQRFVWIQNALNHLNIKVGLCMHTILLLLILITIIDHRSQDSIISEHCSRLLPELEERVKRAYYAMVVELGVSHPAMAVPNAVLRRLGQLVQACNQLWPNQQQHQQQHQHHLA
ncbi:hypothetical protein SYNPS1DRAFT_26702 [Syncephalis pseudoplumigaleata]|uniref:Uncharacterized protein n=1 Tax=Syncephalis pseudoplumigaleata TaxID=1712513 RepID=A0A4P9Z7G3_9FUNG|nr:hypothetical protein SYNPS1DRAFT_26702 [Syncephalis pseudoplumigaleata]|eukprot:RKP27650.1 hypothetical protein SYNPS1DRAFT_26702 [Syncephalis pseudoplumigaleata]